MTNDTSPASVTVPPRSAIPRQYTWNAESVFPSLAAWEAELHSVQAELPKLGQYQDCLKDNPAKLADALLLRDELARRAYIIEVYAGLSHAVDKNDQGAALLPGKAQELFGQVRAAAAFIEPEMIGIGQPTILEWMRVEPRLGAYGHYFEDLFRKQAHIRSGEVEELLGMLASPFASVYATASMLTDADLKFKPAIASDGAEIEVAQGSIDKLMVNPDRQARQTAWNNYMDSFLAFKNSLASSLATSIRQNTFHMRARRHASTLEAALFNDNIPPAVYFNLLETFRKNLPTWHRYFALRRKALGVEQLETYDIWAPLAQHSPAMSYEQTVDWICAGLAPLGQEYVQTLRKGCLQERWVDVYPNQAKSAGAFSSGSPGTHPFIVMSYTDDVPSLSTLAHELGHSLHSYLTWKNQPFIYSDYSSFVAEVASNFNQAMVRAYLLETQPDVDFQISLIEEAMANFIRYFLIMPTLARFELQTHQLIERGEGLNANIMIDLMAELFAEAYGGQVHIDHARVGITWATFPHLYADYYVFQYATGISGANALAQRVLSGALPAAQDYLSFLKAGSSLDPLEALKLGGVDLTTPQPVEETFAVMAAMIDRLEALLDKASR